jgi:hypothetical protein
MDSFHLRKSEEVDGTKVALSYAELAFRLEERVSPFLLTIVGLETQIDSEIHIAVRKYRGFYTKDSPKEPKHCCKPRHCSVCDTSQRLTSHTSIPLYERLKTLSNNSINFMGKFPSNYWTD